MNAEKNSSSTLLVKKTIDEWCSLFAKDVNCKLFQSFYELLKIQGNNIHVINCVNINIDNIMLCTINSNHKMTFNQNTNLTFLENFTTEYFSLIFSEIRPSILHLDLDAVYLVRLLLFTFAH